MALPVAPGSYSPRDQDEIRRILTEGVDGMVRRIYSLEQAPPIVIPPSTSAIKFGLWDALGILGKGPGNRSVASAGHPLYSAAIGIPATNAAIPGLITQARAAGIHMVLNLVRSPSNFYDVVGACHQFNKDKYIALLDAADAIPELDEYLASGDGSVLVFDEPLLTVYCGSITRKIVNDMGLETKRRWPGTRTIVRASSNVFAKADLPVDGWTGIDYGIPQYGRYPTGSTKLVNGVTETAAQYFIRQKAVLAESNVGVIPGINLWAGGGTPNANSCWDYLNSPGGVVSSGRIHSTITTGITDGHGPGDGCPCSTPANGTYFVGGPEMMREWADYVATDPDFQIGLGWTHILSNFQPNQPVFSALEMRSDMVGGHDYMVNKLAARTVPSNGWRTTK